MPTSAAYCADGSGALIGKLICISLLFGTMPRQMGFPIVGGSRPFFSRMQHFRGCRTVVLPPLDLPMMGGSALTRQQTKGAAMLKLKVPKILAGAAVAVLTSLTTLATA